MQDESNVKLAEQQTQRSLFKRMRKAILEGDWPEFDKLCGKMSFQQQKSFQYSAYREQFIELIEAHEYQKAFTHLTKRLKPLERSAASAGDFKNLCYLLTCRSVHEVLPHWQGVSAAREALLAQFATMMDLEERQQEGEVVLPASRLVTLLEQAAAYQVSHSATAFGGALATAAAPTDTAPTVSVPDAAGAVIYGIGACGTAPLAVGSAGSAEPASMGGAHRNYGRHRGYRRYRIGSGSDALKGAVVGTTQVFEAAARTADGDEPPSRLRGTMPAERGAPYPARARGRSQDGCLAWPYRLTPLRGE
jgi:hypothetical protein